MEKEFVPYEQALALKELGFDKECFGATFTFKAITTDYITFCGRSNYTGYKNSEGEEARKFLEEEYYISRPTFSQAFRWFREKYGYFQLFDYQHDDSEINKGFFFNIININNEEFFFPEDFENKIYKTYEEAELTCLNKLIEIIKNK